MTTRDLPIFLLLALVAAGCADDKNPAGGSGPAPPPAAIGPNDWAQWAQGPRHQAQTGVIGQPLGRILADVVVDANVEAQKAETGGSLLTHYQVPLVVDQDVLMAFQSGTFVPCSPPGSGRPAPCGSATWDQQVWSQRMLRWDGDELVNRWSFTSDWKPVPDQGGLAAWEPVFHAALAGDFAYIPGAGGSVYKLSRDTGAIVSRVRPFAAAEAGTFVAGPLTADPLGNIYYNAIRLNAANPWFSDALGAWLVRVAPDDAIITATYAALVSGAPAATASCETSFSDSQLPWPPSPGATPPQSACGSPRPGINVAPAIAPDGTIYTISRAHMNSRYGHLVAVHSDMTPKWAASLRGRLEDGCGSAVMPATGSPGGCRAGARANVDPATNSTPAGRVLDSSSSSPTVAPDGSILYGAYTRYNGSRGHLMKFSSGGAFQASYHYGWDVTPAIYNRPGGGYAVVIKDNHYGAGSYCNRAAHCPRRTEGPYDMTQLTSNLTVEWKCPNLTTESCNRQANGEVSCVGGHPNGFEWCVNAPVVAADGAVYANAEDGRLWVMEQGGTPRESIFLDSAIGAAYTPIAIGRDGRVYTQNNGRMFVIGN